MAGQSLEFTISASDQASKVVTSVQNKIQNFGKDVGKSIAGVLGPMALVGFAVSKVTEYLAEMEKKAKEAFDFGAGLSNAADKLGVTVEQFQQINNAAEMTGSSVDEVGKAFLLAAKRLEEARSGNQDAIDGLGALGIGVEDLSKTKPEDVLARLAGAMAAGKDPTEAMAISMAALGNSAKELQKVLAKGFDIKGAMVDTEGLTQEEADILRESERKKREKANKEKVASAKQAARDEFLATEEGKAFVRNKLKEGTDLTGGGRGGVAVKSTAIDAEIARLGEEKRRREEEKRTAIATNPANVQAAAKALEKAAADVAKAEEEKKKPEKERVERVAKGAKVGTQSEGELGSIAIKSAPLMVSSLREIGGGMAGEKIAEQIDLQTIQVDLTRSMLTELQTLNNKSRDTVDFTKLPIQGGVSNFTKTLA
jgi:CRISPR/Cas system-associated protein Cas5 (RAMP superfamily)